MRRDPRRFRWVPQEARARPEIYGRIFLVLLTVVHALYAFGLYGVREKISGLPMPHSGVWWADNLEKGVATGAVSTARSGSSLSAS